MKPTLAIVLQQGTLSETQVFTIATSFLALTLGASNIFLQMATKDKSVREASWKTTWFLVLPPMFFVVFPRVLTISLIMSYTKEYFFVFLAVYLVSSIAINFCHVRRDPSDAALGILTNLFASCIVIQEGSGFFKRSAISSSILHIFGLFGLCIAVGSGLNTCPYTEANRHAPILHCFQGTVIYILGQ